ncbi:MAG: transposase [Chloroflexota bacterium]
MATADLIIHMFCLVDDRLGGLAKHPQARLWPSELVTIGLLYALKGGSFRSFYRWLAHDHAALFAGLPERTRLLRALRAHHGCTDAFLADPTFFTVIDTYGIELLHPWRAGRSARQVGRKGFSNHRWIVGLKLCWLINDGGEVVAWDWHTANVHDQTFAPLVGALDGQTITLADTGFHAAHGDPSNLKICPRGSWNESGC